MAVPTPDRSKQTPRGIIVVDASALWDLAMPLPEAFLTEQGVKENYSSPIRFSDGLIYLAQHGYKVVIPEMVAFESGCFLRNGKSITKDLDKVISTKRKDVYHLFKSAIHKIVRAQEAGADIQIEAAPHTSTTEEAHYLERIQDIYNDKKLESSRKILHYSAAEKDRPTTGAGARVCNELLYHYSDTTDAPLFFLTNSSKAGERILEDHQLPRVSVVGSAAFYKTLATAGVFKALHIKPLSVIEIEDNICAHFKKIQQSTIGFSNAISNRDLKHGESDKNCGQYPFNANIEPIRTELDAAAISKNQTDDDAISVLVSSPKLEGTGLPSAVDKWKARYSGR